jgi:hypothetical protein
MGFDFITRRDFTKAISFVGGMLVLPCKRLWERVLPTACAAKPFDHCIHTYATWNIPGDLDINLSWVQSDNPRPLLNAVCGKVNHKALFGFAPGAITALQASAHPFVRRKEKLWSVCLRFGLSIPYDAPRPKDDEPYPFGTFDLQRLMPFAAAELNRESEFARLLHHGGKVNPT